MNINNQNNKLFKASRESHNNTTVKYNDVQLIAYNKYDLGSSLNFDWGNNSIESEALALAILTKVGSQDIASKYAKKYMKNFISKIQKDTWFLETREVIQWINDNTNYTIDESKFENGHTVYTYEERRKEQDRRNEDRRTHNTENVQERRNEDRRKEERRIVREKEFQEKIQKRLKEFEKEKELKTQNQPEANKDKEKIISLEAEIKAYKIEIEKYKNFIHSLDIESMYKNYAALQLKDK